MSFRGKDVMTRRELRESLLAYNEAVDGPWEPAVFVSSRYVEVVSQRRPSAVYDFIQLRDSALVQHDPDGRLDLHLPGDGRSFDVDAAVAKLWVAEVVEDFG